MKIISLVLGVLGIIGMLIIMAVFLYLAWNETLLLQTHRFHLNNLFIYVASFSAIVMSRQLQTVYNETKNKET